MTNSSGLFKDFNKVSSKEWKQKIQVDLKGDDYQTLITKTFEGIDIKPFYHYDDYRTFEQLHPESEFSIVQELQVSNPEIANKIARNSLQKGAEYFTFYLNKKTDLSKLLQNLDYSKLIFKLDFLDTGFFMELVSQTQGKSPVLLDPIGHFGRYGNWYQNEKEDFSTLQELQKQLPSGFRFLEIDTTHYKNAGANLTQELAYAMSHAVAYAEKLGSGVFSQMYIKTAQSGHYFFEIAKLKALRSLWQNLIRFYEEETPAKIYAVPARRNKTIFDPYVNLLRTGMEMMSAVLGGADMVANLPFDAVYKKSNAFSERLARNQLIILKNEAYFAAAKESTTGNYYLEEISRNLAEKSLIIFKDIEKAGGLLAQLYKGTIQRKIRESAEKEQVAFDRSDLVLVGTNKYINPNEEHPKIDFYPFIKKRSGKTLITPIIPKRLSEKIEMKRLQESGIEL